MENELKPFGIEINTLGFHIHRVLYAMIRSLTRRLKENNLNLEHSDFTILMLLGQIKGCSQSEIARVLGKERSGVSRSIVALEKEGILKREPLDGKTNYVTLTEKGEQIIPTLHNIADQVTEEALKGFSHKKRESLINSLNKIFSNASSYK